MRKSSLLALDVLKTQADEATSDSQLLKRSIAHEETSIRTFDTLEAEELRIAALEYEDRKNRIRQMFEELRGSARTKIALAQEHLHRVEGSMALDERAQAAEVRRADAFFEDKPATWRPHPIIDDDAMGHVVVDLHQANG